MITNNIDSLSLLLPGNKILFQESFVVHFSYGKKIKYSLWEDFMKDKIII